LPRCAFGRANVCEEVKSPTIRNVAKALVSMKTL
jgi:hypothetical protein